MKQINCRQLCNEIGDIKKMENDFNFARDNNYISICKNLMKDIASRIESIEAKFWSFETLTIETIKNQYREWQEMYQDLNPEYKLPSIEQIFNFLKKDHKFLELMKTKEKQGFTRMVISPAPGFFSLKDFTDKIEQKIKAAGGNENYFSPGWQELLIQEERVQYFGSIVLNDRYIKGLSLQEISLNPDDHSICDGWMISFTTNEQNIKWEEKFTVADRFPTVTNLDAFSYQDKYFNNNEDSYRDEEAMIPQEFFALFADDLYKKYIRTKEKLTTESDDLFSSNSLTWFISTQYFGQITYPSASWHASDKNLDCPGYPPAHSHQGLGVRSVMRRNLKRHE